MKRRSLYFTGPGQIEVLQEDLAAPAPDEVQVHTQLSTISAGTELLLFRGEASQDAIADESLPALSGNLAYPLKFGYCALGQVMALGSAVGSSWLGRRVFAFNPHESAFNARPENLQPIPEDISDDQAVFLANMETAVNLVLDAQPRLGERVAVLGQGVVGLLTTALLAQHPLDSLVCLDRYATRRARAEEFGASAAFDPSEAGKSRDALGPAGADLVLELSGQPEALNLALELVGAEGRIVVGSWYGARRAAVQLDERFHRGRLQIISSQVGRIAPALSGRWDRARRFDLAWQQLTLIQPSQLITHRFPLQQAEGAYRLLAEGGEATLGVLFTYAAD